MGDIEVLPNSSWDAKAALKSAFDNVSPDDQVLVLYQKKGQTPAMRSANLTTAEAVYLLEDAKLNTFFRKE